MKPQKSCGPCLGKLVHQLPGVVTFAYDLRFRCMIARWKGIVEEIYFRHNIERTYILQTYFPKKTSFRASKWPWKLKPAKNSKFSKLPENYFELVGKGGWPSISTWINLVTFRIIEEDFRNTKTNIFCCFVDFRKDFDMVPRKNLWNRLEEINVPLELRDVAIRMYEKFIAKFENNEGWSKEIN
jgi:hypothetical protein